MTFCDCENGKRARAACERADARKRQNAFENAFRNSGIPSGYVAFTLETWEQRAGKDAEKQDALAAVRKWLDPAQRRKEGLFLYGATGTGKTGLLAPIFAERAMQSAGGLWIEYFDFIASVQSNYGASGAGALEAVTNAQTCPLLALDDFGTEDKGKETDDRLNIIYRVVNARTSNGLPMLISSNLSPTQCERQFTTRTWMRIQEHCEVVKVSGANWRKEAGAK